MSLTSGTCGSVSLKATRDFWITTANPPSLPWGDLSWYQILNLVGYISKSALVIHIRLACSLFMRILTRWALLLTNLALSSNSWKLWALLVCWPGPRYGLVHTVHEFVRSILNGMRVFVRYVFSKSSLSIYSVFLCPFPSVPLFFATNGIYKHSIFTNIHNYT